MSDKGSFTLICKKCSVLFYFDLILDIMEQKEATLP